MASQSYQLVMRAGPNVGKSFPISKAEIHLGRDVSNDVVINDAEVSRKHVRIVIQPSGEVILEDLGSTNGTFVNDQRISGVYVLTPGDSIQLGEHVTLVFEAIRQDPDATVAVGSANVLATEVQKEPAPPPPADAPSSPQYQPSPASTAADMPLPPTGPLHAEAEPALEKNNRRTIFLVGAGCLVLFCLCGVLPGLLAYWNWPVIAHILGL